MSKGSQTGAIPNSIYPLGDSLFFLAGTNSSSNYWFAEIGFKDSTKSNRIITSKSPNFRKGMNPVSYSMYDCKGRFIKNTTSITKEFIRSFSSGVYFIREKSVLKSSDKFIFVN
jgi:hypothetical protein